MHDEGDTWGVAGRCVGDSMDGWHGACREMAKALKASPVEASGLAALLHGESREDRRAREEVQV